MGEIPIPAIHYMAFVPVVVPVGAETIDGTERKLDLTGLADYPYQVELEAVGETCLINVGDGDVELGTSKTRIENGGWRVIAVTGAEDGYVALKRSGTGTGELIATLVGKSGIS